MAVFLEILILIKCDISTKKYTNCNVYNLINIHKVNIQIRNCIQIREQAEHYPLPQILSCPPSPQRWPPMACFWYHRLILPVFKHLYKWHHLASSHTHLARIKFILKEKKEEREGGKEGIHKGITLLKMNAFGKLDGPSFKLYQNTRMF